MAETKETLLVNGSAEQKSPVRRMHSATAFTVSVSKSDAPHFDPYKTLERSQSEAALLKNPHSAVKTEDGVAETFSEQEMGTDGMDFGAHNVSECSKVYLDLSTAEAYENINEQIPYPTSLFRTGSGRLLETIPQDEELQTDDVRFSLMGERSISTESNSSASSLDERASKTHMKSLTIKEESSRYTVSSSYSKVGKRSPDYTTKAKTNMKSTFQTFSLNIKQKIKQLQMGSVQEQIQAMREISVIIDQAWAIPSFGRDLAYGLCDILRNEKALDIIVKNCASPSNDLMKASAKLLDKILTTGNRKRVSEIGLDIVVKMAVSSKGETEMARVVTGILESLFKISEDVCAKLISLGGLDVIVFWCRSNDRSTLRHCSMAVANMALYGGRENQEEMTKHKVPEWLFPLAFNDDDGVRYYACLAIAILVANKEIETVVQNSGTLEVVLPFLTSHTPSQFARMELSHQQGRSKDWLKRLVGLLSSKREEAQALAAFHFAMEAGIKMEQGKKDVFYEIGAIEPLKCLASSPNPTTSKLASEALRTIGEELPHKLSQQVPIWNVEDVVFWVNRTGYDEYTDRFARCKVDGDLLLTLTEADLACSLGMDCRITQKRFLRDVKDLKIKADYTSCDPTGLSDWLQELGSEYRQYTYTLVNNDIDKNYLMQMTDEDLKDCGITNSIHRKKISQKIAVTRSTESSMESVDAMDGSTNTISRPIDVFISYRRVNGSQLASLLKVHLQLRGFSVFLDIEKLKAGKFDENLLNSVRLAKNFILVLTPNALDRCMEDDEQNDWVHKEIVAAMENGCNIIPLLDNFHWPPSEKLPQDMRQITFFNGIRWIHDYQDACVDKLEKFLRGEINMTHKRAALFQMGSSSEGVVDGGKYSSSEESSPSIDVSPNRDVSYSS
ncbi:NAD(+) hydrolase sarm1-like isoform X2 [Saccostrea echinata]|uniref:NAD(+) hydrolase sarm1-like isoform X2 n=1 Tax=Saccostrea echinata TaxID=191078 RepID=UPI002A7F98E9|nr:NAD(+) hydrolase sarm1-like isoform X2 [Saccostrea echinata]XP_061166517.1 NAD(+) hydrolase sarm1-like isoform X2 [Saccostrea echinata]